MEIENLLLRSIRASVAAGDAILEVYHSKFSVEHKADDSPLTLADRRSHEIITGQLAQLDIPLLSEEGRARPYDERRAWDVLWIIDPLDGTKEFVKRNDEFTVNVALVKSGQPVLGVIYVPVKRTLYFAARNLGAFKIEDGEQKDLPDNEAQNTPGAAQLQALVGRADRLPLKNTYRTRYTIAGSRSHGGDRLKAFVADKRREYGAVEFISAGSSLKICLVAEGRADVYPRFGPTCEWDTAAGQAIAEAAGARVLAYETGTALVYNKEDLLNPWFIVKR